MNRPFIITVASEKGGVGKTTIATNLAVYLKALREDLPVTIASFDNHFSVDQMFALGGRPEHDMSSLFDGLPMANLVNLGQYGVQYVASSRHLDPPDSDPKWLFSRLLSMDEGGIFIFDTRPILDWCSKAALMSADLVIVPVKDRASLINASSLRKVLGHVGRSDRMWLLPSLVDSRARLNAEVKVHQFLGYAAKERDYNVLDMFISKSPKVEGLASGFSSRIFPVLTHARNTAVHSQFKQLAEFALNRFEDDYWQSRDAIPAAPAHDSCHLLPRRRVMECPVCGCQTGEEDELLFFDWRSRRRGYLHMNCYENIVSIIFQGEIVTETDCLALVITGPGLVTQHCHLTGYHLNTSGEITGSVEVDLENSAALNCFLEAVIGRQVQEAYRDVIIVGAEKASPGLSRTFKPSREFVKTRRNVFRGLHQSGLL